MTGGGSGSMWSFVSKNGGWGLGLKIERISRNFGTGIGVAIGIGIEMSIDSDLDPESDSDPDTDRDGYKHSRRVLFMPWVRHRRMGDCRETP